MKLYTIRDIKVSYMDPYIQRTEAEARRTFMKLTEDKTTMVGSHPEDYELWEVGSWDEETGLITTTGPKFILGGVANVRA